MALKHLHYAWVMVITAALVMVAYSTINLTFGIFLRPLSLEFNWERGALSAAYSIKMFLGGVLGIPAGRLCDRYGPRFLVTIAGLAAGAGFLMMSRVTSLWQAYIAWGVLMGIAGGSVYIPVTSTIPRWFHKKRAIAVSITATGFGLGGVISPPLAQWLIDVYGWQQAFVVLGLGTMIVMVALAQFMRHSPQSIGLNLYGEGGAVVVPRDRRAPVKVADGFSFKQAIKTGRFWIFSIIMLGFMFCLHLVQVHIAPFAVDVGLSAMVAASILSIMSGISVIGRLAIGFISEKAGARPTLATCLVAMSVSLAWLLFASETWMFYVFTVIFGIAHGGVMALQPLIPAELFGLRAVSIISGAIMLYATIGGAIGPLAAGTIFDATQSYHIAFLICVVASVLAVVLGLFLLKARAWGDSSA